MRVLLRPSPETLSSHRRAERYQLRWIERLRAEKRVPYKEICDMWKVKDIGGLNTGQAKEVIGWLHKQGYRNIVGGVSNNSSNSNNKIINMKGIMDKDESVVVDTNASTAALTSEVKPVKHINFELSEEQSMQLAKIQEWYRSPSALHTLRLMIEDMSKGVEVGNPLSRLGNNTRVEPLVK